MRTSGVLAVFLTVIRTVYGDCNEPTGGPNTQLITDLTFPVPDTTQVTFSCEVGYRKVGPGTVTCNGEKWTDLKMRCEKRNCGSAGEVTNGYFDYSEGTEFGAFARVVCNDGYMAVGSDKTIYCGVNGWQGRPQECEVLKCDAPNTIENGYFSPMKDEFEHSEVITYGCDRDFILNGSRTASCQEDGNFKPAPPKCVSVNCETPKVTNGNVVAGTFQSPYKYQSSVTFKCDRGHTLQGHNTVSCDVNSKWSPPLPLCNAIECKIPEIKDGEIEDSSRLTYKFEETIIVKCNEGYRLNGQRTLTCSERNQWAPTLPQCILIECPTPEVKYGVVGGAQPPYKYRDTVTFQCNSGYVRNGDSTVKCEENGLWSAKLPQCTLIECPTPEVKYGVVGGAQPPYKYKDVVTFQCNSGYVLNGDSTVKCEENGLWSAKLPQCTQVLCRAPEVTHGQVVKGSSSTYKYLDSVVFECKSGYTMIGQSTLTCARNSQWSPELPQCTPNKSKVIETAVGATFGVVGCLGIIGLCYYCLCLKKKKGAGKEYRGAPQDPEPIALS